MNASPSLRDLAKIANVDVSTVSRALHNDPRVSDKRIKEIKGLARRMGYRQKPLRSQKTRAIGLLIGTAPSVQQNTIGENFLERVSLMVQQELGSRNYHVNIECVSRKTSAPKLPAFSIENRIDGVLVLGHPDAKIIELLRTQQRPIVGINDSSARIGVPCLLSNPRPAINEAVRRFSDWGHRRYALLLNEPDYPTSRARAESFKKILDKLDIPCHTIKYSKNKCSLPSELENNNNTQAGIILHGLPEEVAGGREAVRCLLAGKFPPTALLFCNDWMALGGLFELKANNRSVPDEFSILGHDDIPFCKDFSPSLSSISRSEHELVKNAVEILLSSLEGKTVPAEDVLLDGTICWRDSTGKLKLK
jgi:DNA-binding LacI/PurR family transcriptional regulator